MIVSQFTIGANAYRGVATHHRVLLTNLMDRGHTFRVTVHSRTPNLAGMMAYSVERHGSFMLDLVQPAGANRYLGRRTFTVSARETARIQLRPFDVAAWKAPDQSMEALGYLDLSLPMVWAGYGQETEPQGTDPVDVLLHAFQVDWTVSDGYREPAPVTISTGQAENQIQPDTPYRMEIASSLASAESAAMGGERDDRSAAREYAEDIDAFIQNPGSVGAVLAYLGRVGQEEADVEALNALLREAGHDVRLKQSD